MKIVVLSGAGISAESGVPTFRGTDGLWNGRRPEEVATPEAFRRDPEGVWEWYYSRRRNLLSVEPNAGHRAIAAWQEAHDVVVATQNVDGLHQAAGSTVVHELHGSIWRARCLQCGTEREDRTAAPGVDGARPGGPHGVAGCPCGGRVRPAVIWFGELLPQEPLHAAEAAICSADVVLAVGSSHLVYPAASLPLLALSRGIPVIEVNPEETPLSARATRFLQGTAATILPKLVLEGLGRSAAS